MNSCPLHKPDACPRVISRHQQTRLTYEALDCKSNALARGLGNIGVKKGDRVAVSLGNNVEYAIVRGPRSQFKLKANHSRGHLRTLQDWGNSGSAESNLQRPTSHCSIRTSRGFVSHNWHREEPSPKDTSIKRSIATSIDC